MKRIVICFLLGIAFPQTMWSQDIIITRDSKRIDATIQEISDTEVRYKRQDNPNGPVFVIRTSKISSIMFSNGEVQSFENVVETTSKAHEVESVEAEGSFWVQTYGDSIQYIPGTQLKYLGDGVYKYGDRKIDVLSINPFLQNVCPNAYKKNDSATGCGLFGYISLGVGVACLVVGVSILGLNKDQLYSEKGPAWTWMGVGLGFGVISIPLFVKHTTNRNKCVKIFNEQCSNTPLLR